jgi:hypothetical protein
MRSIPAALRQKLLNRFKVEDTDSMAEHPSLWLRRPRSTPCFPSLYTRTLLRRSEMSRSGKWMAKTASRCAYAHLSGRRHSQIYMRRFPAGFDFKWEYLWFGAASDVALEFNGTWKMNAAEEWYYLKPTSSHISSLSATGISMCSIGETILRGRFWQQGVSQISACKGWQSSVDIDLDQGLIIGYLKDGAVFYRALCCQSDGSYIWEAEHEVTTLGIGNTTLSVIRTNDFRIGFLTQNNGNMLLTLTHRNYAGMSVRPESMHINTANARMSLPDITRKYGSTTETTGVAALLPYGIIDTADSGELEVTGIEKLNRDEGFACYGFKVFVSRPVFGTPDASFLEGCKLSVSGVTVASCDYDAALQAFVLYTSADIRRTLEVTVTIPTHRRLWYYKHHEQRWFLPALTYVASAETIRHDAYAHDTITVSTLNARMRIDDAVFTSLFDEPSTAAITISSASMELKPVSTLPIYRRK